jgi:hypothetical protein
MNVYDLLVRQVSALVSATADMIHAQDQSTGVLDLEADLYKLLEENCRDKAEMARALAQAQPKGGRRSPLIHGID